MSAFPIVHSCAMHYHFIQELMKLGFTRVSFLHLYSTAETEHILAAIEFVVTRGWLFLPQYKPSVRTAAWVHVQHDTADGVAESKTCDITCEALATFEGWLQQAATDKEGSTSRSMTYNVCTLTDSEEAQLLTAVRVHTMNTDLLGRFALMHLGLRP
jgi:hypothetical protein